MIEYCRKPHIYKITDLRNGIIYIGKTLGKRNKYFSGGKVIHHLRRKYGDSIFKREVLLSGDFSNEDLKIFERIFIAHFDSMNKDIGYNLTSGGEGEAGFKMSIESRKKMSEIRKVENLSLETRKRMSESAKNKNPEVFKAIADKMRGKELKLCHRYKLSLRRKGVKKSDQHRINTSKGRLKANLKGERHNWFGKTHSEESKRKISESKKKNYHPNRGKKAFNCRKIEEYDLNGNLIKIWPSIDSAVRKEISSSTIKRILSPKIEKKEHCGRTFKYH